MDMVNRGVIFDMDGVLVDSNAAHFEAFRRVGEDLGVPFSRSMLERTFGMHNNQIFPLWLGEDLPRERVEELALRKEAIYREVAAGNLSGIPGSVELLKGLHAQGVKLAVGSSGPRANVELAVRTLDILRYFDALVTGDDVIRGKPDPEIFLKAAQALGLPPSRCVVIEDAPQGVQAARAAGIPVIAVTTSRPADALSAANLVVSSLESLNPRSVVELVERATLG